jgi:hypothetical protein
MSHHAERARLEKNAMDGYGHSGLVCRQRQVWAYRATGEGDGPVCLSIHIITHTCLYIYTYICVYKIILYT